MSQPYLVAMNHSEWHAKNVLRKFQRNRPLGEIELQHRYRPAQPVLSSRTVDIDASGTRTYRARTTVDIIEEQHRLIHEIYSKARNISSAPPGGNRTRQLTYSEPDEQPLPTSALQSLRVNGLSAAGSESRPSSAKKEFIILKKRPNTTGSHWRRSAAPAIDNSEFSFEPDPAWQATTGAYIDTKQQIHQIWEPEQRTLDEGKFVRGKKDQPSVASSLDPRAGSSWLSFGGGANNDRAAAGVVDAFTAMKHEGQFYAIDGGTGSAVARQLHRGDKIRIGVNGQQPPPDYRIREYQQNLHEESSERGEDMPPPPPPIVPLSWGDQVKREDTVIRKPSTPKPPLNRPNLNESRPVVFKKFGKDGARPPAGNHMTRTTSGPALAGGPLPQQHSNVRVVEGYGISRRTSARRNIDGSRNRPSSCVTHISVNKNGVGDGGEEVKDLSYEDILDMRIKSRASSGPMMHDQMAAAGARLEGAADHALGRENTKMGGSGDATPKSSQKNLPRPMSTISSSGSQDFAGFVMGAPPANPDTGRQRPTSPVDSAAGRAAGRKKNASAPSRPPPLKPNLHKTAAATGQSIGSGRNPNKNTEYINLSRQLCISKENLTTTADSGPEKGRMTPASRNNAAIRSVTDHNKPKEKDVKFRDNVTEIIPQNFSSKMPIHQPSLQSTMVNGVGDKAGKSANQQQTAADSSYKSANSAQTSEKSRELEEKSSLDSMSTSDKKYAFNIPTADPDMEGDIVSTERERAVSAKTEGAAANP